MRLKLFLILGKSEARILKKMYKNCTEYIVDTQACSCFVPDALSTLEKSKITTTISYNKTFIYRVGDCLPHPRGIQET